MSADINQQIETTITSHATVLFMKGTKTEPLCGFSAQVVQVLNEHRVEFHDVNVLARRGLARGHQGLH